MDPEIFVLAVQHADGRPLAVLANYGLHYIGGYGAGYSERGLFWRVAERLAGGLKADHQEPPFVGIMSNGTSGDVNGVIRTGT